MKRVLTSLCVGALALVAVGCGDDAERLSTEEFSDQGNAICSKGSDEVDAAFETAFADATTEPSSEEIAAVIEETMLPNIRGQIDDLRDLKPPKDLADKVEETLDAADAALDDLEKELNDDAEAYLASGEDPFADVNKQLKAVGLADCADSE
jgi:hypothetical protein